MIYINVEKVYYSISQRKTTWWYLRPFHQHTKVRRMRKRPSILEGISTYELAYTKSSPVEHTNRTLSRHREGSRRRGSSRQSSWRKQHQKKISPSVNTPYLTSSAHPPNQQTSEKSTSHNTPDLMRHYQQYEGVEIYCCENYKFLWEPLTDFEPLCTRPKQSWYWCTRKLHIMIHMFLQYTKVQTSWVQYFLVNLCEQQEGLKVHLAWHVLVLHTGNNRTFVISYFNSMIQAEAMAKLEFLVKRDYFFLSKFFVWCNQVRQQPLILRTECYLCCYHSWHITK